MSGALGPVRIPSPTFVAVIEHVRHRVADTGQHPLPHLALTACGRRFLPLWKPTRDTRHHQSARLLCTTCERHK